MNTDNFRETRENIESLAEEIKLWISKNSISESYKRLEEARNLLTNLANLVENDVQKKSVPRLRTKLKPLEAKIAEITSKREAGKKEDGNVAFKCNWNDKYYKAPCSDEAYDFNIRKKRVWCHQSDCREYGDDVSLDNDNYPCYESIALKEMFFSAGLDVETERPRHIRHVKVGRMAVLTTRPPMAEEKDRLITGCLFIDRIEDDPETKIYGDKAKSIEVDYNEVKVKFWDYYKNPKAEDKILWARPLHRYITNGTVLNILKGIGGKYKNIGRDVSKIIELIRYYESLM